MLSGQRGHDGYESTVKRDLVTGVTRNKSDFELRRAHLASSYYYYVIACVCVLTKSPEPLDGFF